MLAEVLLNFKMNRSLMKIDYFFNFKRGRSLMIMRSFSFKKAKSLDSGSPSKPGRYFFLYKLTIQNIDKVLLRKHCKEGAFVATQYFT